MNELQQIIDEQCKDPEFRKGYLQLEEQYKFTDFVFSLMEKNNLTERQLARLSGVKLSTIKKIENIEVAPNLELMNKLANAVGATVDFIPNYEPTVTPAQN